jgi:hypothetical protein
MSSTITGLLIGVLFGGALFAGGLANPDKIVGTLRLKDFHAMRTIGMFVLVGMVGTWILSLAGLAHLSVKPMATISVLLGGALLGAGFGISGYCPGTGLACAASGRLDALVTVGGMFVGALVFILLYPVLAGPLDGIMNYGKITLPEATGIPAAVYVIVLAGAGFTALFLTRPKSGDTSEQPGTEGNAAPAAN